MGAAFLAARLTAFFVGAAALTAAVLTFLAAVFTSAACERQRTIWKFSFIVLDRRHAATLPHLAAELRHFEGVDCFTMGHTRT